MAVRDSKTNKPKEQGGKTGQQMAGGYTMYATSPLFILLFFGFTWTPLYFISPISRRHFTTLNVLSMAGFECLSLSGV